MEINGRLLNFKHSINCGVFSLTCKAISQFVVNIYYDRLKTSLLQLQLLLSYWTVHNKKKENWKKKETCFPETSAKCKLGQRENCIHRSSFLPNYLVEQKISSSFFSPLYDWLIENLKSTEKGFHISSVVHQTVTKCDLV